MPTIGYGEDGLTYKALHAGRLELLAQLEDQTPPKQCIVHFRPSFGRGGSPQFGEFDAILSTEGCVYLIEAKWNSGDHFQPFVALKDVQIRRHQIFTWLYRNWVDVFANGVAPSWAAFAQETAQAFTAAFPARLLAPNGTLLARNLQTILTDITQPRRELKNVLLYFSPQGVDGPGQIVYPAIALEKQVPFLLISLPYDPIGESRYFLMPDCPECLCAAAE